MKKLILVLSLVLIVSGCATWSTSDVVRTPGSAQFTLKETIPENIKITTQDITNRPYTKLGDISVTVNKTTVFHSDPTEEKIDEALREEAAELGANAVILVKYGEVKVTGMSWGSRDGSGKAVKFNE